MLSAREIGFDELEARADGWDDSFHAFKKREEGHVEEIKSLRKDVDKMQEVLPSMQEAQTKHKKQIIELEQLAKRQQTVTKDRSREPFASTNL